MFRSEKMGFYDLVMPRESAWDILNELGELSALQFVDSDPEISALFMRPFSNQIKRCEECLFRLCLIENEMKKHNKEIIHCANSKGFFENLRLTLSRRNKAEHTYFEELEHEIETKSKYLEEQIKVYDSIFEKRNYLLDYREVLEAIKDVFGNSPPNRKSDLQSARSMGHSGIELSNIGNQEDSFDSSRDKIKLNYITGVINEEDSLRFKRILFRVSKGNIYVTLKETFLPMEEVLLKQKHGRERKNKIVFFILCPGGVQGSMKNKIDKVCDSFSAVRFNIPDSPQKVMQELDNIEKQLKESKNLMNMTNLEIENVLDTFSHKSSVNSVCSYIEELRLFMVKEKTIYHHMNMLKLQNSIYHGRCWCPREMEDTVVKALHNMSIKNRNIAGGQLHKVQKPEETSAPTYFKTNKFTWAFQEIVNTYGIPRYREINPGLYTIITFPFLFGMMFGDIGHGLILFLFGIYLCHRYTVIKQSNSLLVHLLPARYLIALMGFFAFYCGFLYNDFLSIQLNLFGSCYDLKKTNAQTNLVPKVDDCVYPIGLDPIWSISKNEISFHNSLKMKLSVIFGVLQMTLGVLLKSLNSIHFRKPLDFFFEFIPQIVFMLFLFGYMVLMIFIKWGTDWSNRTNMAPSIISLLMNMPLKFGSTEGKPLWGENGSEQEELQLWLLIIALLCVPLMLFPKPLIMITIGYLKERKRGGGRGKSLKLNYNVEDALVIDEHFDKKSKKQGLLVGENKKSKHNPGQNVRKDDVSSMIKDMQEIQFDFEKSAKPESHFEQHSSSEIFVHQIIETIEFVLGSVSNTASYLRLWALSLAHGQLSKVFFEKTIGSSIENGSIIGLFIGFILFANLTFGVLLCMDCLECFLHALRLHWVEFQNKFYKADGYRFEPLSFHKAIMETEKK